VLGDPPVVGTTSTAIPHELRAHDPGQKVDQWIDRATKSTFSPKSLAIAGGLIVLAAVLAYFSTRTSETLEDRVKKLAEATVQGDLQTVRQMAASGTTEEAVQWYEKLRDRCDDMRQNIGTSKLVVEVEVKQTDDQGSTQTIARVDTWEDLIRKASALPDASIKPTGGEVGSIRLPMAWKDEGWFGWKLDGKRALELASASP
jgi:hypothetical protein